MISKGLNLSNPPRILFFHNGQNVATDQEQMLHSIEELRRQIDALA